MGRGPDRNFTKESGLNVIASDLSAHAVLPFGGRVGQEDDRKLFPWSFLDPPFWAWTDAKGWSNPGDQIPQLRGFPRYIGPAVPSYFKTSGDGLAGRNLLAMRTRRAGRRPTRKKTGRGRS